MLSKKQKVELWRIKERYRLSRPWFNLFYKYPPIINWVKFNYEELMGMRIHIVLNNFKNNF